VSNRLHQVRLAQADSAVKEQRIVGLRRPLGHGLRRRLCELIAAAHHEGIELIARVQLRRSIPIEACLLRTCGHRPTIATARSILAVAGLRRKAAILAHPYRSLLRWHLEHHLVDFKAQVIDRLADQVAVPVANMLKLLGRNSHVEGASADV
jgi:hypothetical protein